MQKLVILIIFLLALVSRVVSLDKYPGGFTQDEAAQGYDAYSILKTGKDMWGQNLPLILRSFGDFKLPAYTYFTIPSVAIFGLNEFAVRLPSAIFGALAVVTTYLMVLQASKRRDVAFWSALFMAASPWHFPLSRGAFEANLSVFFMSLGVWMYLLGLKNKPYMVISALAFGVNLFTYHSARYITPLLMIFLLYFSKDKLAAPRKGIRLFRGASPSHLIAIVVFLLFAALTLFSMFSGGQKRAADIAIFNPTDKWASMADKRYEVMTRGLNHKLARLFSNKVSYSFKIFTDNYLNYLSPTFLFVQGAGDWSYGMIPGRGVLYLFQVFLLVAAFVALIKNSAKFNLLSFFFTWVLISPLAAALTKGPGYAALRVAVMMPAIQVISAYGAVYIADVLQKFRNRFSVYAFYGLIAVFLIFSVAFFAIEYIYLAPSKAEKEMQFGMKETVSYVFEVEGSYDRILYSRSLSVPHIWVLFYKRIDPLNVQEASQDWLRYESEGYVSIDQLSDYRLNKYLFSGNYYLDKLKNEKVLFIGKPYELGKDIKPLKIINYSSGEPAYFIYSNSP